jgi:hypothetical protein
MSLWTCCEPTRTRRIPAGDRPGAQVPLDAFLYRGFPIHVAAGIDRGSEQVVTRAQPISLTEDELDKDHQQLVQAPEPIPVRAWARYPETSIRADGRASAWTARAVCVDFDIVGGDVARA